MSVYSGAGNTFTCFDDREGKFDPTRVSKYETDGVLLLQRSSSADLRLRIYNCDGSEADMCGNGLRCLHRFAQTLGFGSPLTVETRAGILRTWDVGDLVGCTMPPVQHLGTLEIDGLTIHWIDSGVPHAVLFVNDIEEAPLEELGPRLRHHPSFGPTGTNVDFVEVKGPSTLALRTYERGVERETLACGTGALAAATAVGTEAITVITRSGERLLIHRGDMVGPAEYVINEYIS